MHTSHYAVIPCRKECIVMPCWDRWEGGRKRERERERKRRRKRKWKRKRKRK